MTKPLGFVNGRCVYCENKAKHFPIEGPLAESYCKNLFGVCGECEDSKAQLCVEAL